MVMICATCSNAIIAGACVSCGSTKSLQPNKIENPSQKGDPKTTKFQKKMAAPIPNSVRPMDEGGKKSLMNYFGYTTKKGVSKEKRRSRLRALINSELIPSEHNVSYIKSFKDPGSLERILKIAQILENQTLRMHYVDKSHTLYESWRKRKDDVAWLKYFATTVDKE